MEIVTLEIIELDEQQLHDLKQLLTAAFPTDPSDLLGVEIQRAGDPRLGRGLVAIKNGQIAGGVLARKPRGSSLFVVYLAVAPPYRRRGIARSLLKQLTSTSCQRLEMFVTDNNVAAESLYRAGGLAPVDGPAPTGQQHWVGTWESR